jgi:hypothetical protein
MAAFLVETRVSFRRSKNGEARMLQNSVRRRMPYFKKTLATFGSAGEQTVVQTMLAAASDKAKTQHERLEALLAKRGGTPRKVRPY